MITVKDILEGDYSVELKEELKSRDPSHIFALLRHTDGRETYVTCPPTEMDIKRMRLRELCDKTKDGEVDLTESETKK